jgi:diguanylate cyclase (GGDEF)-like protein
VSSKTPPADRPSRPRLSSAPSLKLQGFVVVIHGPERGRRFLIGEGPFVIGRSPEANLVINDERVSRQHATIVCDDDEWRIKDGGSRNGTFLNEARIADEPLRDRDRIRIDRAVLRFRTATDVEAAYHDEIYELMRADGLTGLANDRVLGDAVDREVRRSERYSRPLTLLLFELDRFPEVVKAYGGQGGDAVLMQLADLLQTQFRRDDVLCRLDGERFGVLVPEVDGLGALTVADKLWRSVRDATFLNDAGQKMRVTVSVGLASLDAQRRTRDQLRADATTALERAQDRGGNCIEAALFRPVAAS